MSATIQLIVKAVDQASKELNKSNKAIGELGKYAGVTAAAVTALGIAGKEAWESFGEGTEVIQTADSFDLLIQKIGATPDLLRQLDSAAGGTISQMELMSSTATLLAGVSGEVGTSLANATPQLIEIARAANKLNPSLGTTTFMYESLARGIKRSSPLILDNLGLTIKVGEANQRYASSIGKSVEALTAEEKQQALLNEALRAGNVLIDQVGGNVDSASDSYAKFNALIKDTTDSAKASFATALLPVVEGFTKLADVQEYVTDAIDTGVIAQQEWNELVAEGQTWAESYAMAVDLIAQREQMAATEAHGWAVAQEAVNQTLVYGSPLADMYGQNASDMAAASIEAGTAIRGENTALAAQKGLLDDVNTSLSSFIDTIRDQAEFVESGGVLLMEQAQALRDAYSSGELGIDDLQSGLDIIDTANIDRLMEVGDLTTDEAVNELVELGYPVEDAIALVAQMQEDLYAMTAQEYTIKLNVITSQITVPGTGTEDIPITDPGRIGGDIESVGGGGTGGGTGGGGDIFIDSVIVVTDDATNFSRELKRNAVSAAAGSGWVGRF